MNPERRAEDEVARLRDVLGVEVHIHHDPVTARDEAILRRIVAGGQDRVSASRRRIRLPVRIAVAFGIVTAIAVAGFVVRGAQAPALAAPPMLTYSMSNIQAVAAGSAPPASEALRAIAAEARRQPVEEGHGAQQVLSFAWYINTVVDDEGNTEVELAPTRQATTIGPDGSFSSQETRTPALSPDGRVVDPDRYPVGGAHSGDELPAGTFDAAYAANLPRDPHLLRESLTASQGGPELCGTSDVAAASCLGAAVADLYGRWVVPADLSATVWAMLAAEPALADLGEVTDRLGRSGRAVAVPPDPAGANQSLVLVIDAGTGQLLSWEQVSMSIPDLQINEPTVTAFQAITSARWVD
ncbi:hypothetical protein CTKZ_08710 [Cellulomonas algicola]|uniref:Uncharacterized protein n=1 Tax=Cellulomonas algicola TaxID=2071633 RepID=A0A401UX97_9CELL|nr:CU044_5270 family protein [Cellulomonas algicola]GCD19309.1 hypothetical protein CTKZ_08710 [Cellulomonas algicola]